MELQIPVIRGTASIDEKLKKAIIEGIGEVTVRYVRDDSELDRAFKQALTYNSPYLLRCHYKFPCDDNYTCYVIENYDKCFFSYVREIQLGESRAFEYVKYVDNAELISYIRDFLAGLHFLNFAKGMTLSSHSEDNYVIVSGEQATVSEEQAIGIDGSLAKRGKIILTTPCEVQTESVESVEDFKRFIDLVLSLYTDDGDMYEGSKLVLLFRYLQSSMENNAFNKASLKNLAKNPIFLSPRQFCSYILMARTSIRLDQNKGRIHTALCSEIGYKSWWEMLNNQNIDYSFLYTIYEPKGKLPMGLDGQQMDSGNYDNSARSFLRFSANCVKHVEQVSEQTLADALYSLWPEFFCKLDCILHCHDCSPFEEQN